jgi:hypothetical protein
MELLEYHKVKIFGRIWVKSIGQPMNANAVFTSSVQDMCRCFQAHLDTVRDTGFVIADSRMPQQNMPVAHSIFTQKFKIGGDPYGRIWEMPTFGHSNNHVGLQIADILASALLFPIASHVYCSDHITNTIHVKPEYRILRERYGERLKAMQFRYNDKTQRRCGGIVVSDPLGHKGGSHLFGERDAAVVPAIGNTPIPIQNASAVINLTAAAPTPPLTQTKSSTEAN